MGYTHYWRFKKKAKNIEDAALKFKVAVDTFKRGLELIPKTIKGDYATKEVPFKLCDGVGKGEPKINDEIVIFNGDASIGQDGETFCIALNDFQTFDCCKTFRCAYDTAVCLALLCFKDAYGDDFSFSSDGEIEDGEEGWKLAKEIFEEVR